MGRYQPGIHDTFIKCDASRCGANNAPEGSAEYDTDCWRCGESLSGKPKPGDEVTVDIVDEKPDGTLVCKMDNGFVLFLEEEVSAIQATVRVTSVDETYGQAEVVETEL
ncbi:MULTISPECIES: TRAM domain-containing protein [Natrialbaceae]|uniref:TRAM domain-containing protein n=1 Tax=Natrialbaceae TaxID=1644061 RepID=UPI00207C4A90|nr:TRAM domain-containing protein [Natronococcus sp. CG52]